MISGEESRPGRKDYWNSVFLAGKTPMNRISLELFKVFFIMSLVTSIMMGVSRF
jgi:hypothetical protein